MADPMAMALAALGRKERSVAELGEWLRGRGLDEGEVEELISRLIDAGALDDARFAARFAEDKRELAGWGSERIRAALLDRQVPREHVEEAVREDPEEEVERAAALLGARAFELGDERERGRALGFLARRGFEREIAEDAIRRCERA